MKKRTPEHGGRTTQAALCVFRLDLNEPYHPKKKMIAALGAKAPDFTLTDADGVNVKLRELKGTTVILYFYPTDHTETCTKQACDFRDNMARITASGARVIGISPDSVSSHRRFTDDFDLPFTLLADETRVVCEKYGVWQLKKLYGREYMGVVRSTFVIDQKGIIRAVFSPVRLKGHIDAILQFLRGKHP